MYICMLIVRKENYTITTLFIYLMLCMCRRGDRRAKAGGKGAAPQ